uniref:Uncharacterized protein n=1 Tax=Oryza sativa subsp. japonica TaxID=39947 RepID=Q33A04_ORYSJ|nr:hypothetical protein LOC_Os10g17020 [Oryza sativa Japonica Group]
MAAEEGAEPSARVAEDGGASSASAPAPSLPPSAPAASTQVPNTADLAKAAMAARMQEQQQAYEAARRSKVASAPILQYSVGYVPPQVYPQAPIQPLPPQVTRAPVYFVGQPSTAAVHPAPHVQLLAQPIAAQVHPQPPGQVSQTMAEGASALQAQLQAFLQQVSQPHSILGTTPSAHPEENTSQVAPSWLPSNQTGLGASPWSQGPQFDFINAAQAPTVRPQAPTPGFGANQAPNQVAMAWSQPTFDPSMVAQQASPIGAGQPNAMAQPYAKAVISPFTTPYPQQGAVNRAGGEKGLPLSGGIKTRPIPPQFKFPPVPRYSGEIDPKEFLSIYESAIEAAHDDENTKAKPQMAIQGQPPRQGQAPMTWRKFRTDRAGKAVMDVEEVKALRKEFDTQQAGNHQ